MPRVIPPALLAELQKKQGVEPVLVLEVTWTEGGNIHTYTSKDVSTDVEGAFTGVLHVDTLESVVKLDQSGQTHAISLRLSDVDGHLKNIINYNNVHGQPCGVSQWAYGIPFSARVTLFQGEVTGPIRWSEGDRTLSFEVITKLADKEIGFSPEQGLFPDVPTPMSGKPWPLVFGHCQNVPATALQDIPRTATTEAVGAADPVLNPRIEELKGIIKWLQELVVFYATATGVAAFQCEFEGDQEACNLWPQLQALTDQAASQLGAAQQELSDIELAQIEQEDAEKQSFGVQNGEKFPQGQTIVLVIGDVEFTGTMNGDTFTVDNRTVSTFDENFEEWFGFTFIQAGATVRVLSDYKTIYIANLLQSDPDSIIVRAWKGAAGEKWLATVPTNYYTVVQKDLGPFTTTFIEFTRPLSSYDSDWTDEIYVTQESVVGPNTVDVVQWLVETFTDLTCDATSFATVRTKLENYPSHFAVLRQYNVLELIEDILFQARSVGFISNGVVYLKYLADEQGTTTTFLDEDIEAGSILVSSTRFEDVITKIVAEWTDDYALETPHTYVLRHNVPQYGLRERTIPFFIYNIPELVIKSATFWLIRMSNIWKEINFKTFLHKLDVETFDTVSLEMTGDLVAEGTSKGLVTELSLDAKTNQLSVECWVPVKFGEMDQYVFAWPHDVDIDEFFPQPNEIPDSGSASPQKDVEADLDFRFRGPDGFVIQSTGAAVPDAAYYMIGNTRVLRPDTGDQKPSDLDDTKPSPHFVTTLPISAEDEEAWDLAWNDYVMGTIDESGVGESNVFPGVVRGKVAGTNYLVDVYENGIENNPTPETVVIQLQIAGDGPDIPNGTWVHCVKNEVLLNPSEEDPEYADEWTMQVPVWL